MTRNARHLEILIGIILVILGVLSAYLIYWGINWRLEFMSKHFENPGEISWGKIAWSFHLQAIICLLIFLGGLLIIAGKKPGWYLVSIISIYSTIQFAIVAWSASKEGYEYYLVVYLISLFFLIILSFMLSNQVRAKYHLNKKSLLIVLIGVSALMMDRFVL